MAQLEIHNSALNSDAFFVPKVHLTDDELRVLLGEEGDT